MEDKTLIITGALVAVFLLSLGHGGMMGFGWIFWIIILAALYYALSSKENPIRVKEEDSIETLKKRYARGEITREEYMKMKKDIAEG